MCIRDSSRVVSGKRTGKLSWLKLPPKCPLITTTSQDMGELQVSSNHCSGLNSIRPSGLLYSPNSTEDAIDPSARFIALNSLSELRVMPHTVIGSESARVELMGENTKIMKKIEMINRFIPYQTEVVSCGAMENNLFKAFMI